MQKNLVISKKSSNFAVRFEPLAIALGISRIVVNAHNVSTNPVIKETKWIY